MRVSIFKDIYQAYVEDVLDADWTDIAELFTTYVNVNEKADAMLLNFTHFKDVGEDTRPGRRKIKIWDEQSQTNVWNGEYEYFPNTVGRCKENMVHIDGLVLDIDDNYTIAEAEAMFDGLEFVIFTTFSHSATKDKFRVVLPFSRPLLAEDIPARRVSIEETFPGVDRASFSGSQCFYSHSGKYEPYAKHHHGEFIDPYDCFEEREISTETAMFDVPIEQRRNILTTPIYETLLKGSGLHYADALTLAIFCKGNGLSVYEYKNVVNAIAAHDSCLRSVNLDNLYGEAYDTPLKRTTVDSLFKKINLGA